MAQPANLVVFLSVNQNRQFLGAAGHPMVKTPAIDSIAARGPRTRIAPARSVARPTRPSRPGAIRFKLAIGATHSPMTAACRPGITGSGTPGTR